MTYSISQLVDCANRDAERVRACINLKSNPETESVMVPIWDPIGDMRWPTQYAAAVSALEAKVAGRYCLGVSAIQTADLQNPLGSSVELVALVIKSEVKASRQEAAS